MVDEHDNIIINENVEEQVVSPQEQQRRRFLEEREQERQRRLAEERRVAEAEAQRRLAEGEQQQEPAAAQPPQNKEDASQQIIKAEGSGWKDAKKEFRTNLKNYALSRLKSGRVFGRGLYRLCQLGMVVWPIVKYGYEYAKELSAEKMSTLYEEHMKSLIEFQQLTPDEQERVFAVNRLSNEKIFHALQDSPPKGLNLKSTEEIQAYIKENPAEFKAICEQAYMESRLEIGMRDRLDARRNFERDNNVPENEKVFTADGQLINNPKFQALLYAEAKDAGVSPSLIDSFVTHQSGSFVETYNQASAVASNERAKVLIDLQTLPFQLREQGLQGDLAQIENVTQALKDSPQAVRESPEEVLKAVNALEAINLQNIHDNSLRNELTTEIADIRTELDRLVDPRTGQMRTHDPLGAQELTDVEKLERDAQLKELSHRITALPDKLLDQEMQNVQEDQQNPLHNLYQGLSTLPPDALNAQHLENTIEQLTASINANQALTDGQKEEALATLQDIKSRAEEINNQPGSAAVVNALESFDNEHDNNKAIYHQEGPPKKGEENIFTKAAIALGITTPEQEKQHLAGAIVPELPPVPGEAPGGPQGGVGGGGAAPQR